MKKRILALMLTLAMVLFVLPGAVFAADTADNDILTYADLADIDKDIVIPDEASATAELSVADAVRALLLWTGMTEEQLGQLGAWQKEAVLAARLAPSAMNQQPWKIVADKTSVSILEQSVLFKKYAPLDRGICMLHAAVGAAKAGRNAVWKKVDGGYTMKA